MSRSADNRVRKAAVVVAVAAAGVGRATERNDFTAERNRMALSPANIVVKGIMMASPV
jgi:hypothetical protein